MAEISSRVRSVIGGMGSSCNRGNQLQLAFAGVRAMPREGTEVMVGDNHESGSCASRTKREMRGEWEVIPDLGVLAPESGFVADLHKEFRSNQ